MTTPYKKQTGCLKRDSLSFLSVFIAGIFTVEGKTTYPIGKTGCSAVAGVFLKPDGYGVCKLFVLASGNVVLNCYVCDLLQFGMYIYHSEDGE